MRENLAESAHQIGVTLSRSTFDRLAARTEWALSRWGKLFEDRARRGVPRDGHGDLRLDHVYWFPNRPPPDDWIAVDCIEFDERFRYADPIADVAFLAMELALEGRGDIGTSFVAEYLRAARDHDGRELLPFYRSYRAAVRGKVEGIKQAEPEIAESERAAAKARPRIVAVRARRARRARQAALPGACRWPAGCRQIDAEPRPRHGGRIYGDSLRPGAQGARRRQRKNALCRGLR